MVNIFLSKFLEFPKRQKLLFAFMSLNYIYDSYSTKFTYVVCKRFPIMNRKLVRKGTVNQS